MRHLSKGTKDHFQHSELLLCVVLLVMSIIILFASVLHADVAKPVLGLPIEGVRTLTSTYYEYRANSNFVVFHPVLKKFMRVHGGLDLGAEEGTPVHAVEDGVVAPIPLFGYARDGRDGYGNHVIIVHKDGSHSFLYAHLSNYTVKAGDKIKAGDVIGTVGSTGLLARYSHLHLEKRNAAGERVYFTSDFGFKWGVVQ